MAGIFRVNQRTHHGLLLMSELAARYRTGEVLALEEFARGLGLSPKFLEQVSAKLRRAGLVVGRRGMGGGYRLTRAPVRITVFDVVTAIEGPTTLLGCLGDRSTCGSSAGCGNRQLWSAVQQGIDRSLKAVTLASVAGLRR